MKRSNRVAEYPWVAIAIALAIGVPAFAFAANFTALAVDYSIGHNRVLLFGPGATTDIVVATALAVAFGAVGIVYCGCGRKFVCGESPRLREST